MRLRFLGIKLIVYHSYIMCKALFPINVLQARHTVPFSAYREQQPKSLPNVFLLIEIR